ncbi:MAG: hypothetical protein AAGA93_03160 [Actinomycetota bacterium]
MSATLALTDALIYEAGRLTTVAVIVLGLLIALKVVREYLFSGFKAVLAAIIVGGVALWGIVSGPEFFRDQATREADAIINQTGTNAPPITLPGGD